MDFENLPPDLQPEETFGEKLKGVILDLLQTLVLAGAIFVVSYLFLFQPHQVKGTSMDPNFHNEEFLLTDKLSYRFNEPKRGDVVIFKAPPSEPCAEDECEYIKRIIGLPGENVRISSGNIYVNNEKLTEPYLDNIKTNSGSYFTEGKNVLLPENYYFVSGDNRNHSRDSREFGPIKKEAIVGKALLKYWPPQAIGLIPKAAY